MPKPISREDRVRNRRRWQAHLNAAAKSGLSRAEYCRQHHLSYHIMGYWHKKLCREKSRQTFIPVKMAIIRDDVQQEKPGLRVILPGKMSIAVEDSFSPVTLKKLLTVLESR
jgi:hypothetical protein